MKLYHVTATLLSVLYLGLFRQLGYAEISTNLPALLNEQNTVTLITQHITSDKYETVIEVFDRVTSTMTIKILDGQREVTYLSNPKLGNFTFQPYLCSNIKNGPNINRWTDTQDPFPYGLISLWLNNTSGSYELIDSETDLIWKFRNEEANLEYTFIGKDLKGIGKRIRPVDLDSVIVRSIKPANNLNKVIKIQSVDNFAQTHLLQLPGGYGCRTEMELKSDLNSFLEDGFQAELEVSATKFHYDSQNSILSHRSSDFATIDLVSNPPLKIQMIRRRNSTHDVKIIMDTERRISFRLDERRGGCEMSHFCDDQSEEVGDEVRKQQKLTFSNGLELALDFDMLDKIFVSIDGYTLIRISKDDGVSLRHEYYETKIDANPNWPSSNRVAFLTRRYSRSSDNDPLKLISVTIRILSPDMKKIEELYHLNLISLRYFAPAQPRAGIFAGTSLLDWAKKMDVSENCYLENDNEHANLRYYWFKLTYRILNSELNQLLNEWQKFKAAIYGQILEQLRPYDVSILRLPRMELLPDKDNDAIILRLLLLDSPAPQFAFESKQFRVIDKQTGDLEDVAKNLDHCAFLCKRIECQGFSFNKKTHKCLITSRDIYDNNLNQDPDFITYFNERNSATVSQGSLAKIKSELEHRDSGDDIELPVKSDDLNLTPTDSGLSEEDYSKKADDYWLEVLKALETRGSSQKLMVFSHRLSSGIFVYLLNGKLTFENDLSNEFSLVANNEENEQDIATFHEGSIAFRYKWAKLNQPSNSYKARQFTKISREQCELACIDSQCSSFSYCSKQEECITTSIHDIGKVRMDADLVGEDPDCSIMQRDFLFKFNEFPNVIRSDKPDKELNEILNPSECAYSCISESDFICLSFDFCTLENKHYCLMMKDRDIYSGSRTDPNKDKKSDKITGCSHFSRSYLADFTAEEYEEIKQTKLQTITKEIILGYSSDQCAEKCMDDTDCNVFQLCFPKGPDSNQECRLIDRNRDNNITKDDLTASENCHVYSMLPSVMRARVKGLDDETTNDDESNGSGLTIFGGFMLYIGITFVSTIIGCGFLLLKHNNERVRLNLDRIRMMFQRR